MSRSKVMTDRTVMVKVRKDGCEAQEGRVLHLVHQKRRKITEMQMYVGTWIWERKEAGKGRFLFYSN